MSKLEELLKKHCPYGVEYKNLDEIVDILDNLRKPVSKDKRTKGSYPYYGANGIQDYVDNYLFDGAFILMGEDGSVINKDNSPVLNWASGKIWVNNHAHVLFNEDINILRFVFYYLQTIDVSSIVRGTPPKINQQNLRNIVIPLPPIKVQKEIVRILDEFTDKTTKLQELLHRETILRKKQYEYYRDKLLTFNDNVEWKILNEVIISLNTGLNPRQFFRLNTDDAKNYYVTIRELQNNTIKFSEKTDKINDEALKLCNKRSNLEVGDVLFSGTGTIGETAIIDKFPSNWNIKEGIYSIKPNKSFLVPKFLMYLLKSSYIRDIYLAKADGGTVKSVPMKEMRNLKIPVPPLEEQERIVNILDKFDALCNDITRGLPAEIEMRKKQYEYYRDNLLTFKEKKK